MGFAAVSTVRRPTFYFQCCIAEERGQSQDGHCGLACPLLVQGLVIFSMWRTECEGEITISVNRQPPLLSSLKGDLNHSCRLARIASDGLSFIGGTGRTGKHTIFQKGQEWV